MFHNQVQQVQQRLSTVQQMCSQMRQSEQNNQHKLQQIAQEEASAAQQLQRVQQLCQECISTLQNMNYSAPQNYTQPSFSPGMETQSYQPQTYTQTGFPASQSFSADPLFNPSSSGSSLSNIATMSPDSYLASREQLGSTTPNLRQIGQQAGISSSASSSLGSGMNANISSSSMMTGNRSLNQ